MDTRELTCINCPMGCRITVEMEGEEIISITGNTCKRGETYARTEVTEPVRTVTTTIKVRGGIQDRVSCKTKEPVPKGKIFEVMDVINKASCSAPIKTGDILIEDCAGTGVAIVATKAVSKA
jgi:CxxC motif-containing protein